MCVSSSWTVSDKLLLTLRFCLNFVGSDVKLGNIVSLFTLCEDLAALSTLSKSSSYCYSARCCWWGAGTSEVMWKLYLFCSINLAGRSISEELLHLSYAVNAITVGASICFESWEIFLMEAGFGSCSLVTFVKLNHQRTLSLSCSQTVLMCKVGVLVSRLILKCKSEQIRVRISYLWQVISWSPAMPYLQFCVVSNYCFWRNKNPILYIISLTWHALLYVSINGFFFLIIRRSFVYCFLQIMFGIATWHSLFPFLLQDNKLFFMFTGRRKLIRLLCLVNRVGIW